MIIDNEIGKLLVRFPRFSGVIRNRKIKEDSQCLTAYTDGKMIGYSSKFFKTISEDERVFVLAHEILHILFRHVHRIKGRDAKAWNFATDAIINEILIKAGLTPPKGVVIMKGADRYNAEELYELIVSNSKKLPPEMRKRYDNLTKDEIKHMEETHKAWGKSKDEEKSDNESDNDKNKENKNNKSGSNKERDDTEKKDNNGSGSDKESEGNGEDEYIDEKTFFDENEEMRKQQRKIFNDKNCSRALSRMGVDRSVSSLNEPTQLVNWKTMLRNYSKKRKKLPSGNYEIEDGIFKERMERIRIKDRPVSEILLDTSGSIDERLLRGFLEECKGILKDSKIKVGCFDEYFYGFQEVNRREDLEKIKLIGGGGTDLKLAAASFTEKAKNKIIFTDGEGTEPKVADGVLWIVFSNKWFKVPKGSKAVFVDPNEIEDTKSNMIVKNRKEDSTQLL